MVGLVIGIDPGPTTGICVLRCDWSAELIQCTPRSVVPIIRMFLEPEPAGRSLVAIERYVIGGRTARTRNRAAQTITQALIEHVRITANAHVVMRSASEVKPWATDKRLRAAGLYVSGMAHARDAARHALFAAVRQGGFIDPLSRRSPSLEV